MREQWDLMNIPNFESVSNFESILGHLHRTMIFDGEKA